MRTLSDFDFTVLDEGSKRKVRSWCLARNSEDHVDSIDWSNLLSRKNALFNESPDRRLIDRELYVQLIFASISMGASTGILNALTASALTHDHTSIVESFAVKALSIGLRIESQFVCRKNE